MKQTFDFKKCLPNHSIPKNAVCHGTQHSALIESASSGDGFLITEDRHGALSLSFFLLPSLEWHISTDNSLFVSCIRTKNNIHNK